MSDYGVDVSVGKTGGVFKKILKEGTGAKNPQANSEVVVHYVGTLLDGTKFDSSRDRDDPFKFTLGTGSVIKGWDEGVASMRKGELCVLTCTPAFAYGERGSPPKIPANATLQFEVELISWSLGPDDLFSDEGAVVTERSNKGDKIWFDDDYNVVFSFKSEDSSTGDVIASAESFDCKIGSKSLPPVVGKAIRTMTRGETAVVQVNETHSFSDGCQPAIAPSPRPIKLTLTLTDAWKEEDLTPGADKGKVVKIKTVTQGTGWQKPTDSCSVEFKISIASADGTVLRSTDGSVSSGHIGLGELPEAYELALQSMKQGEVALVRAQPEFLFVFGVAAPRNVPADQPLLLTIELVSTSKGKESYSMNHAEKLEAASSKKERANAVFKTGNFKRAKVMYDAASKFFSSESKVPSEKESANALKLACNLNGAQCCIKTGQWKDAAKLADDCLAIDRCNLKALYRRGFARLHMGMLVEAETDIAECERLCQNSAEFAADIARAHQLLKAERAKVQKRDKQVFSKLFSGAGSLYADAPLPAPAKDASKPSDSAASDSDD